MLGGNLLFGGAEAGVIPWTGKAYVGALLIQLTFFIAAGKKD